MSLVNGKWAGCCIPVSTPLQQCKALVGYSTGHNEPLGKGKEKKNLLALCYCCKNRFGTAFQSVVLKILSKMMKLGTQKNTICIHFPSKIQGSYSCRVLHMQKVNSRCQRVAFYLRCCLHSDV